MDIAVTKKRIETEPMRNLLVQGESLVDRIIFKFPKTYESVDMTQLEYSISATNDAAEITVAEVLTKTVTATAVEVAWTIKATFTAAAGELKLMLSGADESGEIIYKAYGEPIYVRKNPSAQGFGSIQATLYEQLLAQINYQIAHMQIIRIRGTYATLTALNAAVTEPLIGDMYNVGDAVPYTVYVWQGEWVSLGALQGPTGAPGTNGTDGADVVGIPAGGTTGQIPAKQSESNYDVTWKTLAAGDVGAVPLDALVQCNLLINSSFAYNQLAKSGTVTLSAGAYGHDGWKAGAGGCTYTFATVNNVTTITITAGTLMQTIHGIELQSGAVCLSWEGTATARIGSGSYGATGRVGTATGGADLSVEFATGTVTTPQLNYGSYKLPHIRLDSDADARKCRKYYEKTYDFTIAPGTPTAFGVVNRTVSGNSYFTTDQAVLFAVPKPIGPTIKIFSPQTGAEGYAAEYNSSAAFVADRAISVQFVSKNGFCFFATNGNLTVGNTIRLHWSAEART